LVPLAEIGKAAESIAGGQLDTRLANSTDPELEVIAASFNDMAATLEARIERDARFASEVSHELRSPLMTLAASVEVLENSREVLPERAQRAITLLKADVDRFQTLVEDLLEISRFDVGAITLFLEEVALGPYVELAIAATGYGDVPVVCDPDAMEAIVRLDKRRFSRVLANILDNARKYAGGATGVRVELTSSTEHPDERWARISIVDEGGGVPPDERELIFGRFSRGTESGKRASDTGVGLGLALVAEHLRLHGGRAWVQDRPDAKPGACFVVELPVVEDEG
jgi:signal transduction histidine kinase